MKIRRQQTTHSSLNVSEVPTAPFFGPTGESVGGGLNTPEVLNKPACVGEREREEKRKPMLEEWIPLAEGKVLVMTSPVSEISVTSHFRL